MIYRAIISEMPSTRIIFDYGRDLIGVSRSLTHPASRRESNWSDQAAGGAVNVWAKLTL